jgi:hypothetical protein
MTTTEPQPAAIARIGRRRRATRLPRATDVFRRERGETDHARRDTRRAHGALLVVLSGLAVATVVYAIVRESPAALLFAALVALHIRLAATAAFRPPERTDGRDVSLIP